MQKRDGGERARVTGRWDGGGASILFCTSMKPVIRVSGRTRWIVPRVRGTLVSRWTRCWTTRGQRDFGRHRRSRRRDKSFDNSIPRYKIRVFTPRIFVPKRESREIRMKIRRIKKTTFLRAYYLRWSCLVIYRILRFSLVYDASHVLCKREKNWSCCLEWGWRFDARADIPSSIGLLARLVRTHGRIITPLRVERAREREESGDESTAPSMFDTSEQTQGIS